MGVPTHGPRCRPVFSRPARCQTCDGFVYYWGCTCGSRVLFDVVCETWSKHRCAGTATSKTGPKSAKNKSRSKGNEPPNVKLINTYTYGVLSTVCVRCGKSVRNSEWDAHNYYTHGVGKKPESDSSSDPYLKRPKRATGPARGSNKAGSDRTQIACPHCGTKLLQKNLRKHATTKCPKRQFADVPKVAPVMGSHACQLPNGTVSTKPVAKCEICSTPVRLDRLEEHMRRVHPGHAARSNVQRGGGQ